jgi:hypothetical protein
MVKFGDHGQVVADVISAALLVGLLLQFLPQLHDLSFNLPRSLIVGPRLGVARQRLPPT